MNGPSRAIPRVRRVVVKIGSAVLADDGKMHLPALHRLATDIASVMDSGVEVVIVTSGAVASGFRLLGLDRKPSTIVQKQASAAVGQSRLMQAWADAFHVHSRVVAQALLTADDLDNRARLLNARRTLLELTSHGVVPIINENDTVSFEEIKLGDNDRLSALVASLVHADLLIILSSVQGLYENGDAKRVIAVVPDADAALEHVQADMSGVGTGGMATKLQAASIATAAAIPVIVASGAVLSVVARAIAGEPLGTFFPARASTIASRKRWIGYSTKPRGALVVDAGARKAIVEKGASLLPPGLRAVEGDFLRGAPVEVRDEKGEPFARGLAAYAADECARLVGRKTSEIAATLGYVYGDEIIHRNDLVVLRPGNGADNGAETDAARPAAGATKGRRSA